MKQTAQTHIKDLCEAELCLDLSIKHDLKALFSIEKRGHALALEHCNFGVSDERIDQFKKEITKELKAILPNLVKAKAIQLNFDARGYFLKIDDEYVREHKLRIERDWGGYGIICPDFAAPKGGQL